MQSLRICLKIKTLLFSLLWFLVWHTHNRDNSFWTCVRVCVFKTRRGEPLFFSTIQIIGRLSAGLYLCEKRKNIFWLWRTLWSRFRNFFLNFLHVLLTRFDFQNMPAHLFFLFRFARTHICPSDTCVASISWYEFIQSIADKIYEAFPAKERQERRKKSSYRRQNAIDKRWSLISLSLWIFVFIVSVLN